MAKKTFVRARLVKGARWYVDYTIYRPETSRETRHRQDFFLNDIADLTLRERIGEHLIRCLDLILSQAPTPGRRTQEDAVTVRGGVGQALAAKSSLRKNTIRGYEKSARVLLTWADEIGWSDRPISEFSKRDAKTFFSKYLERGLGGRSVNNCITDLKALWNELIDWEVCTANPWKVIKPVRAAEKNRRPFTAEERVIVAREIEQTDYWLFRALLLQFFCYIRPDEINKLKFKDFDFSTGRVRIGYAESKVWKTRYPTIPHSVRHYFVDGVFDQQPGNYFILGRKDGNPGPMPLEKTRAYKRHRKILERLRDRGELRDISGLTWYSWKDTGISLHAKKTDPLSTRDQAGHSSFDITLIYYTQDEVNREYADLPNDLF